MTRTLARWAGIGGTLLSAAVALFSYRYLAGIGSVPQNVAANRFFDPWIFVHAGGAATALLLGPLQFLPAIRRWPQAHRWTGRSYLIGSLLGGIAGIILAPGVSTGPIAGTGFGLLGILWLYVAVRGLRAARARRFAEHRRWMIRSFALTFGAVTLRLYIPMAQMLGLDFAASYRAIAWLAWVPNAILAEVYLRRGSAERD